MDVGSKIREARKEQKLSQIKVAKDAGIAVNSLRLYEAGKRKPNMETLLKIADAVNVPLHYFFESELAELDKHLDSLTLVDSILEHNFGKEEDIDFNDEIGYTVYYRTDNENTYIAVGEDDRINLEKALSEFVESFVYKNFHFYDKDSNKIYKHEVPENGEITFGLNLQDLFEYIPEENHQLVINMIKAAVDSSSQQTETPPEE